ncbi:MAG: PAS domain S-box protein, partial [Gallionellaceae bacterium]|nr:PAS domain S-box protein [Gallionellaceae bacterium]
MLWWRMERQQSFDTPALFCAACSMALSGLFFTRYINITDAFNLLGHVYKVVAYLFLYRAVFIEAVENPYRQLGISKTKLRSTLNTIPDLVWLKDASGVYLECNPALERLYGVKRENIIGKTDYDFVDSRLADFFREHDRKAIAASKPSINEEWLTFADGGYHGLFETIKSPMYDETGSLIGVLGIARDITAREKAAEALMESEEKFRCLFQDAADPVLLLKEGRFIDCNAATLKLLGYGSREEFLNSSPSDISPPCQPDGRSSAEKSIEMDAIALREGFNRFEWIHRRRDGADIPIEVTLTSIYVEGERILHVHWRDIIQRKLNEEQLRKLSRAVEQSPVSIAITNLDAGIEYVNEAFVRENGYTRTDAAGRNLCMLNSDKNPEEACQAMYSSLLNGHAWKGELTHRRKDGSEYTGLTVVSPIFDNSGKVTHCLVIRENITERKNNEAKIERLSRAYRLLSRVNEAIVLSSDKRDMFENICSSAMESGLFQLAWISLVDNARLGPVVCSEASGSFLSRLDIRLDDDRCRNWPIVKAIRDDTFIVKQDMDELPHVIPWRGKAAELGLQSVGIFPFHEAGVVAGSINVYATDKQFFTPDIIQLMQELVADVSFALDVFTERKRREEAEENTQRVNAELEYRVQERTRELQAVNRELEAFCYSVSHDLRAPLRSIDGFSQILLKKNHAQLDDTGKGYLERVSRASQHMGQLIDDLLKLSKVTRSTLQRKPADLSALAEEVADELRKADPERKVHFLLQPGLTAYADQGLLRIALDNLLGNAFKYTGRKNDAEIEFGASDRDGETVFFVRDNG